jgi:hypothetical protein
MNSLRISEKDVRPPPATNMFLAYDTAETAQTARNLVDHVTARLKSELAVHAKMWRFDTATPSPSVTQAESEAADADVMIVAFGASKTLPEGLLKWLGEWAKHRHIRSAALGVLPTGAHTRDAGPAIAELRQLARRYGLDFIYHADSTGVDNMASIVLSPPRSQRWTWPANEGAPHAEVPVSEWGIND